jgi:hypothetical protein
MRTFWSGPHPSSFIGRATSFTSKMTPLAILAVLPKCPACIVAYVALATGLGISLTLATYLRFFLIVSCVSALLYFLFTAVRHRRSSAGGL